MVTQVNYFDLAIKYYAETRYPKDVKERQRRERIRAFWWRHDILRNVVRFVGPPGLVAFCLWIGCKVGHWVCH